MITIDEAIKELEHQKSFISPERRQQWIDSMNLAIEALKRVKWMRNTSSPYIPLPGETKRQEGVK